MKSGTLSKFNRKKKLWISPKHPLYLESSKFKVYYCAGILVHARLNKNISSLSNFELERLLTRGLELSSKETIEIMRLSQDVQSTVDAIIEHLKPPAYRFFFMLDLINVSMIDMVILPEEQKSIDLFAKLLEIDRNCKSLLLQFITSSYYENYSDCCQLYSEMQRLQMGLTMMDLNYYMINYSYTENIFSHSILPGTINHFRSNCEIHQDLVIPKGTTLHISNAIVKIHGRLIIEGGTLIIEHSHLLFSFSFATPAKPDACIQASHYATVLIHHSDMNCNYCGGFIHQHNGNLTLQNSSIKNTVKHSALFFHGDSLNIEHTHFVSCYSSECGGAIWVQQGSGQIKDCSFSDCTATNGGAIFTSPSIMILNCNFSSCNATEHGGAIYYNGEIRSNIEKCQYSNCYPKGEDVIQYLGGAEEMNISDEYSIQYSTILDCPLIVTEFGILEITHATLFIRTFIQCSGILNMKRVNIYADNTRSRDLIILTTPKNCNISYCEFDGHLTCGIFRAPNARLNLRHCIFRNTANGRAIYNAFSPQIHDCIFSYCEEGALYCKSGRITNSTFVNCRGKAVPEF